MFSTKRNTDPFPPAKPNGNTNRDLIDIEIALARDMGFEKNIIVFNVIGQSWLLNIAHECDMVVVSPKFRAQRPSHHQRTSSSTRKSEKAESTIYYSPPPVRLQVSPKTSTMPSEPITRNWQKW